MHLKSQDSVSHQPWLLALESTRGFLQGEALLPQSDWGIRTEASCYNGDKDALWTTQTHPTGNECQLYDGTLGLFCHLKNWKIWLSNYCAFFGFQYLWKNFSTSKFVALYSVSMKESSRPRSVLYQESLPTNGLIYYIKS